MLRKIVTAFIALFFVASLASCSTSPSEPWDGEWKADGFSAVVKDKTIAINIVMPDSESVYWVGTFEPASDTVKDGNVESIADRVVLDKSLLGSQDASKAFVSKHGKLVFNISMMGVKRTVELVK